MREESGLTSLSTSDDKEVITRLRASGAKGRVKAILDERTLSLETKTGQVLSVKLNNISRADHHHTTLIPFTYAFIGALLILISIRNLVDPTAKALSLAIGISLVLGNIVTRRPTLTITYNEEDCYALHGPDSKLMDMSYLIHRLQEGLSLADARAGLSTLNQDIDYPMTSVIEEELNGRVTPNPNLNAILGVESDQEEISEFMDAELELFPSSGEGILDSFQSESESIRDDPLIRRARENIETRRNHSEITIKIPTDHLLPPRDDRELVPQSVDFINNEPDYSTSLQSSSEFETEDMFGFMMIEETGPTQQDSSIDDEIQQTIPNSIDVVQPSRGRPISSSEMIRNAQEPNYLPSFAGRDGYLVPGANESEVVRDEPSNTIQEVPESIIKAAKKESQISHHSVEEVVEQSRRMQSIKQKKAKSVFVPRQRTNSRGNSFVKRPSVLQNRSDLRSIGRSFTNRITSLRNREQTGYAEEYSDSDSGLNPGQTAPAMRTDQIMRLRANQDREAMIAGQIDSLRQSNGGVVSDDAVSRMMSHLGNGADLNNRIEGDRLKELSTISFEEFEQTSSQGNQKEGIGGLPRLD